MTDAVIQRICSQENHRRHTEKNSYLLLSWFATHSLQFLCSLLQLLYLSTSWLLGPSQQFCNLGPQVCQLVLLKVVHLLGVHREKKGTDSIASWFIDMFTDIQQVAAAMNLASWQVFGNLRVAQTRGSNLLYRQSTPSPSKKTSLINH